MIDYVFSYREFEYLLLIIIRVASFVFVAPFFGMNGVPKRIKVALSVFISLVIYHASLIHPGLEYSSIWEYTVIVIKEVIAGLIIGFGAQICTMIISFSGRIIDTNIGLTMTQTLDPTTRDNTTISAILLQNATMLVLLISGMYQFLLSALVDSFTLIPIGGAVFHSDRLSAALIKFMSDYLIIGFRITLPVFCAVMMTNVVLGIMAKVAPQMNMFAVGMQIKIVIGLTVLFLTIAMLPGITDFIFSEMKLMVYQMMEGLTA